MANQILIDAVHQEEVRVAVTKNSRLEEYDFEFDSRRPIRGNIYLAKVTRVEPSLQAAFVDYGGNRNGFLPFAEVHPDYYQIPVADKEALLENNYKEISEKLDLIRIQKEKLSVENGELTEQLKSQEDESLRLDKEKKKLEEIQEINIEEKERLRVERENLSNKFAEIKEQLRSQESQNKFLEQAKADLLTQFQALSGKMLDGSRNALLKTTKETVTEPFTKQVETLRKQVEELSKDSSEKLGVLAQTTSELKEKSEDVRGAAQQLTSALRSPNVKGRWGEVNLNGF